MRRRIQLYINNQAADLDEGSLVLFNYTKENIDNPSIVRNSYSKSITLKGTPRNSRIFEGMYRADRVSGSGQLSVLDRIPFKIVADGSVVLESGYCKIDEVKTAGAVHEYTITLYGGLGSLFYGLSVDANGDALSLADLTLYDTEGEPYPSTENVGLTGAQLRTDWNNLINGSEGFSGVVNFCECYNGLPEEFDADHLEVTLTQFDNIDVRSGYQGKSGGNDAIVKLPSALNGMQVRDLRAYTMRPVIRVRSILAGIQHYASDTLGITLTYNIPDDDFYENSWITVNNVPVDARSVGYVSLADLLDGSPTPASFLLSFARMLGLSFMTASDGSVTMTSRNNFYRNKVVDLNAKVDRSKGVTLTPVYADNRWFDFALEGVGKDAVEHAEKYNREYKSIRVDTSYPFNEGVKDVWEGSAFKTAAAPVGNNITEWARYAKTLASVYYFPFALANNALTAPRPYDEDCVYTLYDTSTGEAADMTLSSMPINTTIYTDAFANNAYLKRVQMEEEDQEAIDGFGVFLVYAGARKSNIGDESNPDYRRCYFTSYDAARVALNDGVDCWDFRQTGNYTEQIPIWEFAVPSGSTQVSIYPDAIYAKRWQSYIEDRYDKDTRIMKCYVDFSGMQVGEDLLRNFYVIDGALWVLNKITNYSLTTYDAMECEFVKVMDKDNYINGQI